jgi:uncharacterized membrane protein
MPRIWELDYIRGCMLIFVTLDHCLGFLPVFLHPTNAAGEWLIRLSYLYLSLPVRPYLQPIFIFLFALLSGVNTNFSKNHVLHAASFGLFVSIFLLLHKIGTLIFPTFIMGLTIFNILSILAISAFVWAFLKAVRAPDFVIVLLAALFIAIGLWFWIYLLKTGQYYVLPYGLRGFAFLVYSRQGLDWSPNNFEPLLPSLGFFLSGGLLGSKLYKNKRSLIPHAPCSAAKKVIFLGRYSLYVYLFAPVVIIAFFMLLNALKVL